jgi:uracil-DNA glycosylase
MPELPVELTPKIHESWLKLLVKEFESPYFQALKSFLKAEKKQAVVYPPGSQIFSAFDHTPAENVKVVILGQDPYHGPGQANGLCFSVHPGMALPPSLKNIFKELCDDLGVHYPGNGNLTHWANEGVLLLNATLTVRKSQAGSHQGKGWETFTDAVIKAVSHHCNHVVFILWGRFAQAKESLIDHEKHLILKAAHPSPFSAYNGFFGCKHFSKANAFLQSHHIKPVNWQLP